MISILIPIYNGIEFVDESVMSVVNQTYTEWELLIGVNGHQENSEIYKTAKKYESDSRVKVFDFYNIKGKSNTLNEMVKYCKYDHVALLDVDDIWMPKKLEIQSEFMKTYDIIGTQCVYFGDRNGTPAIPIKDISNFDFFSVNPIINSSSMIRKELCFWSPLSNENGVEDYDLWLRLRKLGKKFYNCEQILVAHRIHNTSAFNAKGNNLLVADLLKKHLL